MASSPGTSRSALIAGATGLVGRELLPMLLASPQYVQVHALLRRALPELTSAGKLHTRVVDFARLPALPPVDDVFITLGTTIKVAGSQAAFRAVDFDAVVNTARAAREAGATRLGVVSALGANARSSVFYNRVKGEMQDAVAALGFESVVIVQPSLLVGDREKLGQPARPGEVGVPGSSAGCRAACGRSRRLRSPARCCARSPGAKPACGCCGPGSFIELSRHRRRLAQLSQRVPGGAQKPPAACRLSPTLRRMR